MRIGWLVCLLGVCVPSFAQQLPLRVWETTPPGSGGELSSYVRTFVSNDSCRIVDSTGNAPCNERVLFYDKKGRLFAYAGMASEVCCFNFVKWLYDEQDSLAGFIMSGDIAKVEERLNDEEDKQVEEHRGLCKLVLRGDPDATYFSRYYLQRDEAGKVRMVYDPQTDHRIRAEEGYRIRYEVVESEDFWRSDLVGGGVLLNFYVEPRKRTCEPYRVTKYAGYKLQWEECYEKGLLVERVLYAQNGKQVVAIRKGQGKSPQEVLYEKRLDGDPCLYRSVWRAGRLFKREMISPYGTVLRQTSYVVAKDGKTCVEYVDKYNYQRRKLERMSERNLSMKSYTGYQEEQEFSEKFPAFS